MRHQLPKSREAPGAAAGVCNGFGKAVSTASYFEIDDVIDPADSRRWIATALAAAPPPLPRHGKKRPCIDTW